MPQKIQQNNLFFSRTQFRNGKSLLGQNVKCPLSHALTARLVSFAKSLFSERHDNGFHPAYNRSQESPRRNLPPCSLPIWREGESVVVDMVEQDTVTNC